VQTCRFIRAVLPCLFLVPGLQSEVLGRGKPLGKPDALAKYIPEDVWLYTSYAPTPEREFLDKHWGEVWQAIRDSGIGQDILRIMSSGMDAQDKASFDEFMQKARQLINGVVWEDLVGGHFVFAERFTDLVPDIIILLRPAPDTLEQNVNGLVEIFKAIDQESDKFLLTKEKIHGADVWSLELQAAPVGFYLAHHADVVGLFMGRHGMDDSLKLMKGLKHKEPLSNNQRFRKALSRVGPSEFTTTYMNMHTLFEYLTQLPTKMFGEQVQQKETATIKQVLQRCISQCDVLEYVVVTGRMEGHKEHYDEFCKLKPKCQNTLLYKLFSDQRAFEKPHRFVPKDAKGFALGGGLNPGVLYEAVKELITHDIPGGQASWQKWETWQDEVEFHLYDDLLSWISGEYITVSLPSPVQNPFGASGDGVLMVRVADPAMARQKLEMLISKLNGAMQKGGQSLAISPASAVPAEGFQTVTHPMIMMFLQPCLGVWEDWLVIGTSEKAIKRVIETATNESAKTIRDNPRFQNEGLMPKGAVSSLSFTDLTNQGQELAQAMAGVSMGLGMYLNMAAAKDPDMNTEAIKGVTGILSKIAPILGKIDFYSSMSTMCIDEKDGTRTRYVTVYKPYKETKKSAQAKSNTNAP